MSQASQKSTVPNMVLAQRFGLRADGVACRPHDNVQQTVMVDLIQYKQATNIKASLADPDDSACTPFRHLVLIGQTIYEKT
ncbi:hypothetical protein [Rhodoferax aquaticus]|uniref:Uncharacterized protein n=1 Tax=Rhodoferax aquaticus TaxID=2527691 RepID=A0A515EQV4_9BURK|nr:hypothetical protein [Rhodoferax aquaticus]QDL54995.1 hypothetical protein EXZ61_12930 [Rhodoferax aquaticus]